MDRMGSFLNYNYIAVIYFKPFLAVKSQNDIRSPLNQPDFDVNRLRNDQGSIGQGKGADWG